MRYGSKWGRLATTSAPAAEPVTTALAKSWLRVSGSDDDTLIDACVKTARQYVENYCQIRIITQTVTQTLDDWPGAYPASLAVAQTVDQARSGDSAWVELLASPVASITSVTTYDDSDNSSVWSSSEYRLSVAGYGERARLVPVGGKAWPSATSDSDAIVITYVCGFGASGSSVPEDILTAIRMLVASLYENRGDLTGIPNDVRLAAKEMVQPYRILEV